MFSMARCASSRLVPNILNEYLVAATFDYHLKADCAYSSDQRALFNSTGKISAFSASCLALRRSTTISKPSLVVGMRVCGVRAKQTFVGCGRPRF